MMSRVFGMGCLGISQPPPCCRPPSDRGRVLKGAAIPGLAFSQTSPHPTKTQPSRHWHCKTAQLSMLLLLLWPVESRGSWGEDFCVFGQHNAREPHGATGDINREGAAMPKKERRATRQCAAWSWQVCCAVLVC